MGDEAHKLIRALAVMAFIAAMFSLMVRAVRDERRADAEERLLHCEMKLAIMERCDHELLVCNRWQAEVKADLRNINLGIQSLHQQLPK